MDEFIDSLVENYRAALSAFAKNGAQAFPHLGPSLQDSLLQLRERVSRHSSPQALRDVEKRVEGDLEEWSRSSFAHLDRASNEVRDIMKIVASTAQAVGERDQRYADQFRQISARLQSVAALSNVNQMRDSLAESIRNVNTSVQQMVDEGEQSVGHLKAQISAYQARLVEAEHLAQRDALTGLENRRGVEQQLEWRLALGRPFSVIMIDLNGFKPINDRYGHLAGDTILKQFAKDLRPLFRSTDTVGRWGGDEFMILCAADAKEVAGCVGRIRQWVFGRYTIECNGETIKTTVNGAIGVASWNPGESAAAVLGRADADMYRDKAAASKPRA